MSARPHLRLVQGERGCAAPRVTILRDRYVRGWPDAPGKPPGERAYVLELGAALAREYSSDAHFTAYRTPIGRRLVRGAIDRGVAIELTAVVFDIDGPNHAADERWRRGLREKVQALAEAHPGLYYYETRGGARIVYRQDPPTVLRTHEDALEWSRVYSVARAYLARRFGIDADRACCDWQRLYRLPHATRDRDGKPENWPTWGDPHAIGVLTIDAAHEDVERAKRESARVFRARRRDFVPSTASGEGLLFWLLRARGEIVAEAPRGGWIVLCPNRAEHTSNTDGTDSTVLFPPGAGEQIGMINCLHAHCAHMGVREWLRFFSDAELESARAAAGIVRSA